jgi:hypothetical protein
MATTSSPHRLQDHEACINRLISNSEICLDSHYWRLPTCEQSSLHSAQFSLHCFTQLSNSAPMLRVLSHSRLQEEYSFSHPYTHRSCSDGGASKVPTVEVAQPNNNPAVTKTSNFLMIFSALILQRIRAQRSRFWAAPNRRRQAKA